MKFDEAFCEILNRLMHTASERLLLDADFKEVCEYLQVSKMYYDMQLGDSARYLDYKTNKLVIPGKIEENKIVLFDNGEKTDLRMQYDYFSSENKENVHAYIEFKEGVRKESLELGIYQFMADTVFLLVSRQNMRFMLNYAEITDPQTGIPNGLALKRQYEKTVQTIPAERIAVLYINLQNFKYINEAGGVKCGDEAITIYARKLLTFVEDNEAVCHMDGDNFVLFVKNENLKKTIEKLQIVHLEQLSTLPDASFDVTTWIGISEGREKDTRTIVTRIEEAAAACSAAKNQKKSVMYYSAELENKTRRNLELIAMFPQAVKRLEIQPFYQAKVDMMTGRLVGFEALCRWIHDGKFIYPDQFIPLLDREGLIHELDMAIFKETCKAIKSWKDMGLNPPCVSTNFSRMNLFNPDIEDKISRTIRECGISSQDIEVEITETVNESEYSRLVDFVHYLKNSGIHVSIDDFGTGYSSLSLIHNIDADVVKIDKSFVDAIPGDKKSEILIKSVINIANHLNMSVIVEGVETAEQARELIRLGCRNVQGYFYSKPVDYDAATELLRNPHFEAV